jgi:hypothetical protein
MMTMTHENLQISYEIELPTAEDTNFKFPNTDIRTAATECPSWYDIPQWDKFKKSF